LYYGYSFLNDFILLSAIVTVYFQMISNCDGHLFFQTTVLLQPNVVTIYFQTISNCDGCFVFQMIVFF